MRVEVTGVSSLVRDQDAVFFGSLDKIDRLDPREGKLVADASAGFRSSRLWLESIRRGTPVPASETRITVGNRGLLDRMDYQLPPAAQALQNLRPAWGDNEDALAAAAADQLGKKDPDL